jgi:hypothetical protein
MKSSAKSMHTADPKKPDAPVITTIGFVIGTRCSSYIDLIERQHIFYYQYRHNSKNTIYYEWDLKPFLSKLKSHPPL